jgi:hypothetical protein
MSKRLLIAFSAFLGVIMLAFVVLLAVAFMTVGHGQERVLDNARTSDPRIARMYELYPGTEAKFNDGNRAGRRGAFAPIVQTLTLSVKLENGYELKLYRGIGPDGVTLVEGAYSIRSPTGRMADLTEGEFDALLDAKGDVEKLNPEVWKRPRLPTKHL